MWSHLYSSGALKILSVQSQELKSDRHLQRQSSADLSYITMSQQRRPVGGKAEVNRAVVVSVAEFYPGVKMGNRAGAKRDAKRLHSTLSRRGFKVELHSDLSGAEIYELFEKGNQSHHPEKPTSNNKNRTQNILTLFKHSTETKYLN